MSFTGGKLGFEKETAEWTQMWDRKQKFGAQGRLSAFCGTGVTPPCSAQTVVVPPPRRVVAWRSRAVGSSCLGGEPTSAATRKQ